MNKIRRLAFALGLALPLAAVFFGVAGAEPLRLAPPSVETAEDVEEPAAVTAAALQSATEAPVAVAAAAPRRYNVVVLGDSLGDGTWAGLYHVLRQDKRFNVIKKSRVATGFSRADYYDWNEAVREISAEMRIDIAVVVMGTNDRQAIVEKGARYALFDDNWREVYKRRVDDFIATLHATGARVYWLELPVMRSPRFGADMARFNEIFEDRTRANSVAFVRTGDLALGDDGAYTAYGADRFGRKKLLRADDGIHFTMAGYELLGDRMASHILADVDGGFVAARTDDVNSVRHSQHIPAHAEPVAQSVETIGLKAQVYDLAERRPGRSDDWHWTGAAN